MRILIADFDETYLEILQSYLWDHGYEAEFATSGMECVAVLKDFLPDVLLLERDLLWGGGDGVLDEMRKDPRLSNIPVVLISNRRPDFNDPINGNIAAWLKKPFQLSQLLDQVTFVTRTQRSKQPLAQFASMTATNWGAST